MKNNKKSPLKDRPLHVAGQSTDNLIQNYVIDLASLFSLTLVLIFLTFLAWTTKFFLSEYFPIIILITTIAITIYFIYKFSKTIKIIKSLKLGRDGERIVAEILDELRSQGFTVFHDIVANNFNIDHTIITPHGIFTIETKTFSKSSEGRIFCKNDNIIAGNKNLGNKIISQAESESKWLKSMLKESTGKDFYVMPVIVFPGWFVQPMPGDLKKRIWILNPKALKSFIINEPKRIDESDLYIAAYHISRYIRMYN